MSRLETLIAAANDINTVLKMDPPIDTGVESAKELKQRIKKEKMDSSFFSNWGYISSSNFNINSLSKNDYRKN